MRPNFILTSLVLLATTVSVQDAMARGPAAPHIAAAPHMAAAPHFAAPRMAAPRMAAPRMAAPRMAAPMRMPAARPAMPHFNAAARMPVAHMPAQHFNQPHMPAQHFNQPHMPAHMPVAHMPAQHFNQPHIPAQHFNEAHMQQPHMQQAHMPAQHINQPHMPGFAGGKPNQAQQERMHLAMGQPHIPAQQTRQAIQHERAQEIQMEKHGVDPRAAHQAAEMNRNANFNATSFNKERLQGMHPGAAPHMEPINNHAPQNVKLEHEMAMMHLQQGNKGRFNAGHVAAGALGGAAVAGFAAHQMHENQMHQNQMHQMPMPGHGFGPGPGGANPGPGFDRQSHVGSEHGFKGTRGVANVPPRPIFANPRQFNEHNHPEPSFHREPAGRLAYHPGVPYFPRGGDRHKGVPGVYDPGAYLRTPREAATRINAEYARRQIERNANWRREIDFNRRNYIADRARWPWRLPQQRIWWNPGTWGGGYYSGVVANTPASPYAANPWGGNPDGYNPPLNLGYGANPYAFGAYGNPFLNNPYAAVLPYYGFNAAGLNAPYWDSWNNYDQWNGYYNGYGNVDPGYYSSGIFGALGSMFGAPQGVGLGAGNPNDWMNNLLYAENYSINGNSYPAQYFAMNGYVPTPYVFNVADGQFWQPGVGYCDYLPPNYQDPITVASQEVVPQFDGNGNITGYAPQTFYNDAYWDDDAQCYGYYDYRKRFHWAKLPGIIARVEANLAR